MAWTPAFCLASIVAISLASAGCTRLLKRNAAGGLSSQVDRNLILPDDSTRMQLESNQVVIPGELTNPELMPVYPETLLDLRLADQTVCVSFVVQHNGSVAAVAPVYGIDGCPGNAEHVPTGFIDATVAAVSRWDYFSYVRCTFPPGTPDAQKCNGPGAVSEQIAVTLAYRFLFSSQDGSGTVRQIK